MTEPVVFRPGTVADSYAVFHLFEHVLADLIRRLGYNQPTSADDPDALAQMWEERRSLYDHLARTASHFWLAQQAGRVVGFARSIRRNGVFQLTELFVSPEAQGAGVGRSLLERAFPAVLAHAEGCAADADRNHFGVEVPMINRAAVDYLLSQGYFVEPFVAHVLTDRPFGHFDRYLITAPPFFL